MPKQHDAVKLSPTKHRGVDINQQRIRQRIRLTAFAVLIPAALTVHASIKQPVDEGAAAEASAPQQQAIEALKPLGGLVGEWRGVGQPQRGSSKGAWTDQTRASWQFKREQTALMMASKDGKLFESIRFFRHPDHGLTATIILADHSTVNCTADVGDFSASRFVFVSSGDQSAQYRCTVRQLNDIRMTVLLETRATASGSFRRVAEVGYTRAGERLATSGAGEKQCIVTGGLGSIPVTFEGKTYYVCCEGCKQAFDADPKGTVEGYRDRIAAAKLTPKAEP